jgi:hypothetical protein
MDEMGGNCDKNLDLNGRNSFLSTLLIETCLKVEIKRQDAGKPN